MNTLLNRFFMKYYLIAGEASGDLHGSNLLKALRNEDGCAEFRAWGGDLMAAAGATIVKHYRDLAFMGFLEVAKNIRTIFANIRFCKQDILDFQPDVLILIDYPGFNLRIAKWAATQNIRVFYYISPQLWAWHSSRVHDIKKSVSQMFVILPFEEDFYKKYDYPVHFVGHPLLDVIATYEAPAGDFLSSPKPIIALLPGSRRQEIRKVLPLMLSAANSQFADYQFVIAAAPSIPSAFYKTIINKNLATEKVILTSGKTYDLLSQSVAALVTSGTATLETALFGVPQVVCYRGSRLSYFIAKKLVSIKYISLVNLIADRPIVTELIQERLNQKNIVSELLHILKPNIRKKIFADYRFLRQQLGEAGASARTAKLMVRFLRAKKSV